MTLARAFNDGGLSSLTALNRRLIAQVASEGTSPAEAEETESLIVGPEGAQPEDPDADDAEETPEVRGRFATADPLEYNRIKEWIELNIFGGSSQGQAGLINAFVNEWDVEFREKQGLGPEDDITTGATLEALLSDQEFVNGAAWLPLTGTGQIPPVFTSEVEPQAGEEGEELPEGEAGEAVIGVANPITGVTFHTIEEIAAGDTDTTRQARTEILVRQPTSDLARDLVREQISQKAAAGAGPATVDVGGMSLGAAFRFGAERRQEQEIPHITADELAAQYEASRDDGGGGGRGGGGGGARRTIEFDRDQLVADAADKWNAWMLSADEAPEGQIGSWVDAYTREARAFWVDKGGQLDFDTFITSKLEEHPRFRQIYRDKLPGESPEQFLQKFMQPIASLGLSQEQTRTQTESAVTSGGSPQGQFERVSRTREARVANAGQFSQRLAQTLAGLGVGR